MGGNATQNFWRAAENLSVTLPAGATVERWAVSQAAPYRRMHLRGAQNQIQLWNGGDGWSSGGFMADTKVDGQVVSGSQQQWFSRNSEFGSWTGSVWNMVFAGRDRRARRRTSRTRRTRSSRSTPVVREKPFLYVDGSRRVPGVRAGAAHQQPRHELVRPDPGRHRRISLSQFFVVQARHHRRHHQRRAGARAGTCCSPRASTTLDQTLRVTRPDTVVLGLGLATLEPDSGVDGDDGRRRRRREDRRPAVRGRRRPTRRC